MRIYILFLLALFTMANINICFSQLDTAEIYSDISDLKNDSLVRTYWEDLYESDQNMETFGATPIQIENWFKCVAFFKAFGFTEYQYYDSLDKTRNDYCMYAGIIWMHCPSFDMAIKSYPILTKLRKYDELNFNWRYMNQNTPFYITERKQDTILSRKFIHNNDDFTKVNLQELAILGNEYIEIYTSSNQVVGKWGIGDYCMDIVKTDDSRFFLDYFGIKRVYEVDPGTFVFNLNDEATYLQIMDNGDLQLVSNANRMIFKEFRSL